MQKPDKAPEPSMEEILASIRKIIAEEPIGTRPGPMPGAPDADSSSPALGSPSPTDRTDASAFSLSTRDEPGSHDPPYSVEDALADLIDDSPLHRIKPATAKEDLAPKPHTQAAAPDEDGHRPSWPFGRAGAAPVEPAADPSPRSARGTSSLLGQLGSMRPLPEGRAEDTGDAAPNRFAPQKPAGPGALFDRQNEAARPVKADRAPLPSSQPHQPHQEQPRPGSLRAPASVTAPLEQRSDGQRPSSGSRVETPPSAAGIRPDPLLPQPTLRTSEAAREIPAAPAVEARAEPAEPVAAPAEKPRQETVQPDAPVLGGKPTSSPTVEAAKRPGASPHPEPARELPAARQSAGDGKPATGSASPSEAPASEPATRTLEDTVAELLRPMLRDWLNANMPRIVEKALRGELAASAKHPGTDGSR